ncbi:helix-turn-helix domain-containing protein [Streptomyces sp. x-19]|uniref:helix-turn-helix domain-containing protein n=1 Tax=Streptomyces sp. x-19 TaxID=2789280 RepID=UPI00397FB6B8
MAEHLARRLSLKDLAAHCHMSVRTFTRRFRQETGLSPAEWLAAARLAHVRHLLESTELPVDDIAARAGLGSGTNLRQHMRTTLLREPTGPVRRHLTPFGAGRPGNTTACTGSRPSKWAARSACARRGPASSTTLSASWCTSRRIPSSSVSPSSLWAPAQLVEKQRRELAVAGWLAGIGAPVVGSSPLHAPRTGRGPRDLPDLLGVRHRNRPTPRPPAGRRRGTGRP